MANMPGVGAPAALGIFIGRGARGWNKAANAVAKKMEKQGATPDEIWQQTGNFKAPDGKWRQEISDQAAQHRGQVSRGPAGMVFKHPELYENYPELRDILVRTNPYETKSALTAGGQPGAVIELGTAGGRTENARGMLHELQHDIQFREGFGLGGSELTAFTDPRAHEILKELRAKMAQPASLQEFARDAWKTDKITPEVKQSYQDYLGFRKTNAKNLDIEAQKTAARLYYERLLGEAESRAVEARQFLTPEERRLVLPSQSYKRDGGREIIPLEELIIKRAEGGDVSRSYLDELDAQDDPIRSGRPLQSRTRRKATPEQNEALNRAALQGVANMPYNLVGAPVDLLNMLLTPAGLGSEKPVMGSDWIKQKMTDVGVRPEPPTDPTQRAVYSAADFASNFVNPAASVRAAAKGAEKTGEAARMLAEDFQKYNRALGPAGASQLTTWHGSPYPFKNFDPAKIGTGEGRQAYSQGYYSAEARPVAEGYQRDISRKKIVQEFRKELPDDASFEEALEAAENMSPPAANLIRALSADDWLGFDYPSQAISAALRDLNNFEPSDALRKAVQDAQGYMYKIDIPDEAVAKMLDWDKPLGQQSQTIQDIGKGLGLSMDDLGGDLIAAAGAKTRAGAERLRQAGIPGVRYLDAQSRGGKKLETQNFVVFPGNEDLMRILERNDQPIEGLAKGGPVNTSTAKGQLAKLKAA
jgi:hypothetical protein